MSLDPNKTYLVWNGTEFPNSTAAAFKAPAGSTIDWGDGTVETFDTASTTVNTHTYTDGKTEHTIAISGLTSIDDNAFGSCINLTSITIGNGVTSIGFAAFNGCINLTSITMPNSVTSIGSYSIRFCTNLMSITIPDSVTTIGENAFDKDKSLKQLILFPSSPPTLGSNAIPATIQSIYVQQSSKAVYKAATNWAAFASKIVSDNIYLSFVRFNQKNKEYIGEQVADLQTKINGKLTAPTTPTSDSVVTMAANGTIGTKALSEFGGKLFKHELTVGSSSTDYYVLFFPSTDATAINTAALVENNAGRIVGATGFTGVGNTCICVGLIAGALMIKNITTDSTVQLDYSSMTNISDKVIEL